MSPRPGVSLCPTIVCKCYSLSGSFVIDTAHHLYNDLHVAQEKLVLLNHLHLLYIVTPYSMLDQIKYDPQVYFNVVSEPVLH